MIRFDDVTIAYTPDAAPVLRSVTFEIPAGELWVVAGLTGSGKSTLLQAVNGLVPRFTGGRLSGTVTVAGRSTAEFAPRDLADVVGVVGQNPLAGFVTATVEEELAYGMEQLGLAASVMRTRVEETLDLLGIAELRHRALHDLSGGQQQRVAIGSVLTSHPHALVLDEPTSALDPTAAEDVFAAISRLVHDVGTTVLIAEHRLERVVHLADGVVLVRGDGSVELGSAADLMAHSPVAPPIVELGRLAGWSPLPLSIRDARRQADPLRARLSDAAGAPDQPAETPEHRAASIRALRVQYPGTVAVRDVDLDLWSGQIVALMGRNGSGKSSLLWAVQGSGPRSGGQVQLDGSDPAALDASARRRLVGLVPQSASDLLYLDSVEAECAQADADASVAAGTCRALLDRLTANPLDGSHHPRDLSEGQMLSLVLAIQLSATPPVLLLDEPTRGLDYPAKARLADTLRGLADDGRSIVLASHDVEFIATCCDRAVLMAQGEIVADGPTAQVLGSSPMFGTQVSKILSPSPSPTPLLTVDAVRRALGSGSG